MDGQKHRDPESRSSRRTQQRNRDSEAPAAVGHTGIRALTGSQERGPGRDSFAVLWPKAMWSGLRWDAWPGRA